MDLRRRCKPEKFTFARMLRKRMTIAEKKLWEELRKNRCGAKFRRQVVMRGWIVDFYCASAWLIVEADGGYHQDPGQRELDAYRDLKLGELGFRTMRIPNSQIMDEGGLSAAIEAIKQAVQLGSR